MKAKDIIPYYDDRSMIIGWLNKSLIKRIWIGGDEDRNPIMCELTTNTNDVYAISVEYFSVECADKARRKMFIDWE